MNLHLLGVKSKILSGSGILTPLRALLQFRVKPSRCLMASIDFRYKSCLFVIKLRSQQIAMNKEISKKNHSKLTEIR